MPRLRSHSWTSIPAACSLGLCSQLHSTQHVFQRTRLHAHCWVGLLCSRLEHLGLQTSPLPSTRYVTVDRLGPFPGRQCAQL